MIINQEEVKQSQVALKIELEEKDLGPYVQVGYKKMVGRLSIPGFRKGKAPLHVVENLVTREGLIREVIDYLVQDVITKAIDKQALDAIGLPDITVNKLDPITIDAVIPLKPDVDLGDYKSIRLDKKVVNVTKDDIDNKLVDISKSMGVWEPVTRPVEMGDTITADIKGSVKEKDIIDQKNVTFVMDENLTFPSKNFLKNIVGMIKDEKKEFSVKISDDFPDKEIIGKKSKFDINILEIKHMVLPEINDEFAKSYGEGFENLKILKDKIQSDMIKEKESQYDQEYTEEIMTKLIDQTKIDLSPVLLQNEINHMLGEQERMLSQMGIKKEDYLQSIGKTEEDVRNESAKGAEIRLIRSFSMNKLAELEEIEVSKEEIEDKAKLYDRAGDKKKTKKLPQNKIDEIERMIISEKSIDILKNISQGNYK
ncbi:MAG: trigger factor [Chloroflexi bacterium]|nr:trigger factor [Chloroflexota bacterium]